MSPEMAPYNNEAELEFPRGFLLAPADQARPEAYIPVEALRNLWVHPWMNVAASSVRGLKVVILGICVPSHSLAPEDTASLLLAALIEGESEFLSTLGSYTGRYTVIFGADSDLKIVTDATGMRSVYYAKHAPIVASHALLVERTLSGRPSRDTHPFQYGYPGNRTPYTRTRLLTPNTVLALRSGIITRFWPVVSPTPRDVNSVAHECLEAATISLRNAAAGRKVKLALTAGLDSRIILAVAMRARIPIESYTYGSASDTEVDRTLAGDLAKQFGVKHTVIPRSDVPHELARRIDEAHYSAHHKRVLPGLMKYFDDPSSIAVSGNLLEIGRNFFKPMRDGGLAEPTTPEAMAGLHLRRIGTATRQVIEAAGTDAWLEVELEAFADYLDTTSAWQAHSLVDPFDLFYWEHRMAAWHGTALVERDFYGESFIPFNTRNVFEAMLGVDGGQRDTAAIFYRMIEIAEPDLLCMPINPKSWPPLK